MQCLLALTLKSSLCTKDGYLVPATFKKYRKPFSVLNAVSGLYAQFAHVKVLS